MAKTSKIKVQLKDESVAEETQSINEGESEESIDQDISDNEDVISESATLQDSIRDSIQDELGDLRDKYLRLAAEYDNFRKRSAKEREMVYSNARVDAISKLLPVYDNLERALKMECSDEAYYKGVEMIMTQLSEALSNMGVEEIPAVGEPFDPNRHNAVMSIEDPELGQSIIADEFQKGFILGDRVIRFSTVVVAN